MSAAAVAPRPAPRIEAVLFDSDGTLVDSEPLQLETILAEARALGIHWEREDEWQELRGLSMSEVIRILERVGGHPLPPDFETTLRAHMAEVFRTRLQPMPGALAALAQLRVPFCVATNGPRNKTELTLGLTGLLPLFRPAGAYRVYCAYEVGSFKPEPGLFLYAANALGVAPERCAVVEDSISGIRAGLAAGMTVFAMPSPQPLPAEVEAQVHRLVDGLPGLAAAMDAVQAGV